MCNIVFIVVVMKKRKVVSVSLQFKMCSTADAEHISVISISNRCSAMSCNIYVGQMPTRYGIMLKNSRVQGGGLRQPLPVVSIPLVLGTDGLLTDN